MSSDALLEHLFDVSATRQAICRKLQQDRFVAAVRKRLQQLDAPHVPPESDGIAEEETRESIKGRWTRHRNLGTSSSLNMLQVEISEAVAQMKKNLPPKPWHDTIRFVSFDLPKTPGEFFLWMQSFANHTECSEAAVAALLESVPAMKAHPETKMYMEKMILPFRSFFMAHIVVAVLRLRDAEKPVADIKKTPSQLSSELEQEIASIEATTAAEAPVYASTRHAALHALDEADVRYIESLLPDNIRGLEQHIRNMKKLGVCTRYAQYHANYISSTDATDDAEWIAAMTPLAEAGLAHAQFDVGICHFALGNFKEGAAWLERCAKQQHTKAMLELGRYHFAEAMGWNNHESKTVAAFSGMKRPPAGVDATAEFIMHEVRQALSWLDKVADAPFWDSSSASDKSHAKELLKRVEEDSKRLLKYKEAKKIVEAQEKRNARLWWLVSAVLVVLFACAASHWYYTGTSSGAQVDHDGGTFPSLSDNDAFVNPHVQHRHMMR